MNGSSKGFSLIELMVIIVILATLSTISLPIYQNYMSTSAATTYVGEFSEFKHAYENEALIARREICDADYLSQLKVESEPISALFRSRLSIDKQDGILVEVTAALDQESLAGLEAARLVHQNFQSKGAVVGSPMVTDSFVHFQAALVDCNAQSQPGSGTGSGAGSTGPAPGEGGSPGNGSSSNKPSQPPALSCGPTEVEFQGRCVQPATCPGGSASPSDPTQCQQCGSGFDLIGGACLAECASGEARDASNRCVTVADCKGGAQVSGQPDQCQRCGNGFSVNALTGQCVCDPSTHGLLGGQCVQKANCFGGSVKPGNPTQCQRCGPGYDLVGNQCLPACGQGQARNSSNQCVAVADCHGGQYNPSNPSQCQSCGSDAVKVGVQCVTKADDCTQAKNACSRFSRANKFWQCVGEKLHHGNQGGWKAVERFCS